jgi:hypothetical protein
VSKDTGDNYKLVTEPVNYFEEVGRILNFARKLKEKGIELHFDSQGIRVSTTYSKEIRGEYYYTSGELASYLLGLEDGFWHVKKGVPDIFEEPK